MNTVTNLTLTFCSFARHYARCTSSRVFHLVVFTLLAFLSARGQRREQVIVMDKNFKPHHDAVNFYLFGDWGRDGKAGQKDVSALMEAAAKVNPPQFIISTGDNFYPNGVRTPHDKQWKTSFEDIYLGNNLQCPWYVVLGNHDYHGNPQAEIEYSTLSKRWKMPSRYYVKSIALGKERSATADFIFIDTSPLEDDYYIGKSKSGLIAQDSSRQLRWLDSTLLVSKAVWKFVIGHHAVYTGGKRTDDTPYVRRHLERIFRRHRVDAYFCGHEHDLQYIKPEGPTTYLVSGAGSEVRPTGKLPATRFAAATNGFMVLSLTSDVLSVEVLNTEGRLIFNSRINRQTR